MKQVKFDIELVKKIQSGEIKGRVQTRVGMNARFLGEIIDDLFPLAFAIKIDGEERLKLYSIEGKYSIRQSSNHDIIIEIEETKQEHQFKPFDKVLVRDRDDLLWIPEFFSHYTGLELCKYKCIVNVYSQCIPYEGNEHLLGTTDKPKEE